MISFTLVYRSCIAGAPLRHAHLTLMNPSTARDTTICRGKSRLDKADLTLKQLENNHGGSRNCRSWHVHSNSTPRCVHAQETMRRKRVPRPCQLKIPLGGWRFVFAVIPWNISMSSAVSIQLASNLLHKNKTTRDYYIYHSVLRKTGQFHKTIYTRLLNFSFNFEWMFNITLKYLRYNTLRLTIDKRNDTCLICLQRRVRLTKLTIDGSVSREAEIIFILRG